MTDHQDDDLDEMLRAAARDYNRPSDVPRERMWDAIRAARAKRAPAPHETRLTWLVPAVAAAVLIIGIAIGRASRNWTVEPRTGSVAVQPDSPSIPDRVAVIDSSLESDSTAPKAGNPNPRPTPNAQVLSSWLH